MSLFSRKKERRRGESVRLGEHALVCVVCGNDRFFKRDGILMNTTGFTLLRLDWLNQAALCYVCDVCGYTHFFMPI